jgi:FkbM family methyltransferase
MLDLASTVAVLSRRYPLLSGCASLANHRFAKALISPSGEKRWAPSPGGLVRVSLDDWIGRAVFLFGDLDPKISWLIKRLLDSTDLAIDIGANIGIVTLLMARHAASVQAFEPNPLLANDLRAAMHRNKVENIELYEMALSSRRDTGTLYVPDSNRGEGALNKRPNCDQREYTVQVDSLDDVCSDGEIGLIKIDAEGSELNILNGATHVLQRTRALIIETPDPTKSDVVEFLRDHRFDILAIRRSLFRMTFGRENLSQSHDIIAAPSGDLFRAMCQRIGNFSDIRDRNAPARG